MAANVTVHGGTGEMFSVPVEGVYFARGASVPTDGSVGYAKGCLFIDTNAAAGSILFCNEGDVSSSDFDLVSVA